VAVDGLGIDDEWSANLVPIVEGRRSTRHEQKIQALGVEAAMQLRLQEGRHLGHGHTLDVVGPIDSEWDVSVYAPGWKLVESDVRVRCPGRFTATSLQRAPAIRVISELERECTVLLMVENDGVWLPRGTRRLRPRGGAVFDGLAGRDGPLPPNLRFRIAATFGDAGLVVIDEVTDAEGQARVRIGDPALPVRAVSLTGRAAPVLLHLEHRGEWLSLMAFGGGGVNGRWCDTVKWSQDERVLRWSTSDTDSAVAYVVTADGEICRCENGGDGMLTQWFPGSERNIYCGDDIAGTVRWVLEFQQAAQTPWLGISVGKGSLSGDLAQMRVRRCDGLQYRLRIARSDGSAPERCVDETFR
jgi:hypothetical protein